MGIVPPGVVGLRVAEGGYTDPRRRGYCDGGYLSYDPELKRWKGWVDSSGADGGNGGQTGLSAPLGIGWLAELGAACLAWNTVALDNDLAEWRTGGGRFAVVRPPGDPSTTRVHQFDSTPELEWFAVRENMPQGQAFCVSIYRESTPARDGVVNEDTLPYYYTEIRFGGVYALRLPKWREAELWRLSGGVWRLCLRTPWRHAEVYNDSHSSQEMFIAILPLDGQVMIMASNYTDQAVVWQEDRPIKFGPAAVEIRGNGGACYFGLHDVRFAEGDGNRLDERTDGRVQDARTGKVRRYMLSAWPETLVLGSKPEGCKAELELLDDQGVAWTQERWEARYETHVEANGPGPMATEIRKRLKLSTTDPHKTPIVRWAGLVVTPSAERPTAVWEDLTDRVLSVEGTWQVDLKRRIAWQEYTLELDNEDGGMKGWVGNKRCEVRLGYDNDNGGQTGLSAPRETYPALQVRAMGYLAADDETARNVAEATMTARTKDRLMSLFEVECGYRAPQDGMLVTRAIQDALAWGGVFLSWQRTDYATRAGGEVILETDEIGVWHQSGNRLPASRFEAARKLSELGEAVDGAGADEARAVCQPKPDQSVGDYIVELMKYDPYCFLWYSNDGRFEYRNVFELDRTHYYHEATPGVGLESPTYPETAAGETPALRVMRGEMTHRMGVGERKTAVLVTGRERASGEPLRAYLADVPAQIDGAARGFVGYERLERIEDEKLNSQGMVNLRCLWEYNAQRAYEDRVSFGTLGRPDVGCLELLVPVESRTRAGGTTYVIVAVKDTWKAATGEYKGQIDAVDVDALKGLAGKATGDGA